MPINNSTFWKRIWKNILVLHKDSNIIMDNPCDLKKTGADFVIDLVNNTENLYKLDNGAALFRDFWLSKGDNWFFYHQGKLRMVKNGVATIKLVQVPDSQYKIVQYVIDMRAKQQDEHDENKLKMLGKISKQCLFLPISKKAFKQKITEYRCENPNRLQVFQTCNGCNLGCKIGYDKSASCYKWPEYFPTINYARITVRMDKGGTERYCVASGPKAAINSAKEIARQCKYNKNNGR